MNIDDMNNKILDHSEEFYHCLVDVIEDSLLHTRDKLTHILESEFSNIDKKIVKKLEDQIYVHFIDLHSSYHLVMNGKHIENKEYEHKHGYCASIEELQQRYFPATQEQ
jgi:hypothetical protein